LRDENDSRNNLATTQARNLTSMARPLTALAEGFAFLESPRWHDDRLWVSDMHDDRVLAVDLAGRSWTPSRQSCTGPGESYLKTCRPAYVDKPAVDFRELNFILAHVGTPWVDEALAVALKNRNVYVDISAWQRISRIFPLGFAQVLSIVRSRPTADSAAPGRGSAGCGPPRPHHPSEDTQSACRRVERSAGGVPRTGSRSPAASHPPRTRTSGLA
jgi:hypothetical protein